MKRSEKEKLELLLQKVNLNKITKEELNEVFSKIQLEQKKQEIQNKIDLLQKELTKLS